MFVEWLWMHWMLNRCATVTMAIQVHLYRYTRASWHPDVSCNCIRITIADASSADCHQNQVQRRSVSLCLANTLYWLHYKSFFRGFCCHLMKMWILLKRWADVCGWCCYYFTPAGVWGVAMSISVCLSLCLVCLSACISRMTSKLHSVIWPCYLWPCLADNNAVSYGFVADIIFAHNGLYGAWLRGRIVKDIYQRAAQIFPS